MLHSLVDSALSEAVTYSRISLPKNLPIPNKKGIFAPLESATLPEEQRTRAELFYLYLYDLYKPSFGYSGFIICLEK